MKTQIVKPFDKSVLKDLQNHVAQVRRLFDWPGIPYHDKDTPPDNKFNRWYWHNLPLLRSLHNDPKFVSYASELFGAPLQPSYVFLSMYGPDGVCPVHTDRPQCVYTIDLQVNSNGAWPIYIGDAKDTPEEACKPYLLKNGEAVAYSGVYHKHYRHPMNADSTALGANKGPATYADLVFFHFADANWQGTVD